MISKMLSTVSIPTGYCVVEGIWNGYTPDQAHVVYRHVVTNPVRYSYIRKIVFGDGTVISFKIRQVLGYEEEITENHSYSSLLEACIAKGMSGTIRIEGMSFPEKKGALEAWRKM